MSYSSHSFITGFRLGGRGCIMQLAEPRSIIHSTDQTAKEADVRARKKTLD